MATEKRLIDADVVRHNINVHMAGVIYRGIGFIPSGKDSNSSYEFLRGYEEGAKYIANEILQEKYLVDAVEVVHGRWDFCEPDSAGNRKPKCSVCGKYYLAWWSDYTHCNFCPNCGADMRGDGNG